MRLHFPSPLSLSSAHPRWCVALALVFGLFGRAIAQEYQTDPVDEKAGRNRAIAQQWVRDAGAYAANKDKFLEYFTAYDFPAMSRTEPEKLAELGKMRDDLFKTYLWKTSNVQLQSDLTDAAFKAMGKYVQG